MSKSSDLDWCGCRTGSRATACASLRRKFQESRMSGNPLVRFDEGRVGRTLRVALSPTLLFTNKIPQKC
jgi:hypothetical protein